MEAELVTKDRKTLKDVNQRQNLQCTITYDMRASYTISNKKRPHQIAASIFQWKLCLILRSHCKISVPKLSSNDTMQWTENALLPYPKRRVTIRMKGYSAKSFQSSLLERGRKMTKMLICSNFIANETIQRTSYKG